MYKIMNESPYVSDRLGEDKSISASKLLLRQHPKLYEFLINPKTQWLQDDPEVLLKHAGAFSSGEKILIQAGLDLCFDASPSRLWDIVNRLDSENFQNVIKAVIYMRKGRN
jgi:hypothetical protein